MMKKLLTLLTVAVFAISMVACSNDTPSSPSQDPSSSIAEPSEPDSSTPESTPAETKTIQGVIEDGTMNTVTIKTDDGKSYTFSLNDDTDKTKVDGLTIGDTLIVTYTGELGEDGSTADVVVTALEQIPASDDAGSAPSDAGSDTPSSEPSQAPSDGSSPAA